MRHLLMVSMVGLACGCAGNDRCSPSETRCLGDVIQVCGIDFRWGDVIRCGEVEKVTRSRWTCEGLEGGGHACLPAVEADGGIGGSP